MRDSSTEALILINRSILIHRKLKININIQKKWGWSSTMGYAGIGWVPKDNDIGLQKRKVENE